MGEYYADYDEDTASWCIFHTDQKSGFAYKSFASQEEADHKAEEMNRITATYFPGQEVF